MSHKLREENSATDDLLIWPRHGVLRIEALLNEEVFAELQEIMDGHKHS
jgi:hypothetical protein